MKLLRSGWKWYCYNRFVNDDVQHRSDKGLLFDSVPKYVVTTMRVITAKFNQKLLI